MQVIEKARKRMSDSQNSLESGKNDSEHVMSGSDGEKERLRKSEKTTSEQADSANSGGKTSKPSPVLTAKLPSINEIDSENEHSHAQMFPVEQFKLSQVGKKLIPCLLGKKQSYREKFSSQEQTDEIQI